MSFISKVTAAAVLAISLAPIAGHASTIRPFPKNPTPRFHTSEEDAILKTAKVVSEDTLKYVVEDTSNVCGNTGKAGQNVKVVIRAANGRLVVLRTYGVPENGLFLPSGASECQ